MITSRGQTAQRSWRSNRLSTVIASSLPLFPCTTLTNAPFCISAILTAWPCRDHWNPSFNSCTYLSSTCIARSSPTNIQRSNELIRGWLLRPDVPCLARAKLPYTPVQDVGYPQHRRTSGWLNYFNAQSNQQPQLPFGGAERNRSEPQATWWIQLDNNRVEQRSTFGIQYIL